MLNIREALVLSAIPKGQKLHPDELRRVLHGWGAPMPPSSTSKTLLRMIGKGLLKLHGYPGWQTYERTTKGATELGRFRRIVKATLADDTSKRRQAGRTRTAAEPSADPPGPELQHHREGRSEGVRGHSPPTTALNWGYLTSSADGGTLRHRPDGGPPVCATHFHDSCAHWTAAN